jgi:hypothetical protein
MSLPIWKGQNAAYLRDRDESKYRALLTQRSDLEAQLAGADAVVSLLGASVGVLTEEDREAAYVAAKRGEGVPEHITRAGKTNEYKTFIDSLYYRNTIRETLGQAEANISWHEQSAREDPGKTQIVPDTKTEQIAVKAAKARADDEYLYNREKDLLVRQLREGSAEDSSLAQIDFYSRRRALDLREEIARLDSAIASGDTGTSKYALERKKREAASELARLEADRPKIIIEREEAVALAERRLNDPKATSTITTYIAGRAVTSEELTPTAIKEQDLLDKKAELARSNNIYAELLSQSGGDLSNLPDEVYPGLSVLSSDEQRRKAQVYTPVQSEILRKLRSSATEAVMLGLDRHEILLSGKITTDNPVWTLELKNAETGKIIQTFQHHNDIQQNVDLEEVGLELFLGKDRPVIREERP